MKRNYLPTYTRYLIVLLAAVSLVSCSRKKNKWLNRNFHAMGAYYNVIYNGNLALEQGKEELEQTYIDNYWEILAIERMQVVEESRLADDSRNESFSKAEDKAAKAIQKHNINIGGTEYNPQMDEAFLLLGKARYYDQRFFPALEAFNYIITDYPESDRLVTAKVWREKTNMRMGNNETALKNIKTLLAQDMEFEEEDLADASATLAQAYINLEQKDSAIAPLAEAIRVTPSNEKRGRYLYIKGQLYDRLEQIDSANATFDEVIALNRKTPRIYMINAYMEKARNYDFDEQDRLALLELLQELEEDRENRPYLDKIYYQIAEYYRDNDTIPGSVSFYNKSLRTNTQDTYLKSRNYLTLGNINFDDALYKEAGAYYDSTLTNLRENTREYRAIKKKRVNLEDVILYEDIAVKNDSILNLVNMPEAERLAFFTEYTNTLKEEALAEAKEAAKNKNKPSGNLFGKQQSTAGGASSKGDFYFYDSKQVSKGVLKFNRAWGDRALADNWRYEKGGKNTNEQEEIDPEEEMLAAIESEPQFQPETYLENIPKDEKVIDSLAKERNFAYYQLGIIYKEKFKEYGLASNKLEALLKNDPEERLVLPSKYNLFKIYEAMGDEVKANAWKQNILTNHPDSRYATILKNPRGLLDDQNSPEAVYATVYRKFENQEYKKVIDESNKNIEVFTGNDIVPKFELLKATASGRYYGFEEYKKGLNYVALNYPQSEEGKRAEEIVKTSLPVLKNTDFAFPADAKEYKLVYPFELSAKQVDTSKITSDKEKRNLNKTQQPTMQDVLALKEKIDKAIVEFGFTDLSTSIDIYTPNETLLIVHGLKSKLGAEGFGEKLLKEKEYKIKHQNIGIASPDYKIVQVHKNLDDYISQASK
ncbi:type IX secretion system periplasmic lipoprotein PorW/SprE [Mesonia sp.]|uniref:type IX secretion system periplasmic lipoprotein PorW/SprE n=1 Tax=Mesonia sp. TaxID=1960830 RepID=UPI003F944902